MREIKFRVWDKKNEKLLYNNEYSLDFALNNKEHFVIMQYTHLKDINNKEIYEGDIIQVSYKDYIRIGQVIYGSLGRYQIKGKEIHCAFNHINRGYKWEVIGNIFENEDLLIK